MTETNVSKGLKNFPIVAIGASAGGLEAFLSFFSGIPIDTSPSMAFVLIQHLAPQHKSILAEIIQNNTHLKVFEIEDGMEIQESCIYIIPAKNDITIKNSTFQLIEAIKVNGIHLPINFFFQSLANDQNENAVGIILSGTGSDGAKGIVNIHTNGGIVFAQTPISAEYNGMPQSAISTGIVDYELLPEKMAGKIEEILKSKLLKKNNSNDNLILNSSSLISDILLILRRKTNHDFSLYKLNTIQRRIERRMNVNQIRDLQNYVDFLKNNP